MNTNHTQQTRKTSGTNPAQSDMEYRVTGRAHASRQGGFHLVEVVIATAIIAILAAIAIPSYGRYVDRVEFTTAQSDIIMIVQDIEQYYMENKGYPDSLEDIGRDTTLDPWENAYQYQRIAGANLNGKGQLRKDKSLNPINSDFDLYSMGKDGQTKKPFSPPVSHDDIVRASNGKFLGYAADF